MKTNYVLYARKSTENKDRQVNSIPDQIKVLNELIDKNSYQILARFSESKSAKAPGRKEFNRMIEFIYKNKHVNGIICFHLNRLTRNPIDCATIQWMLQKHIIEEIITPDKSYREEDSDYIMAFEGAGATKFIKDLRRATLRGLEGKLKRGIAPILAPPGYVNSKTKIQGDNDILPHPVYFNQVKKVLKRAITGHYSGLEIMDYSHQLGIRNSRNKPLSRTQTYMMLRNPFYAGKFKYNGELYNGTHQPMLSWSEYELLQDILNGRVHTMKRTHTMLNGLLECKLCGSMFTGEERTKTQKNGNVHYFGYYRCNGQRRGKCNQVPISSKSLDAQMTIFLKQIVIKPSYIQWSLKQIRKNHELESAQRQGLDTQTANDLKNNKIKLDNLYALKLSPLNHDNSLLSDEEFKEQKNTILVERQQINDRSHQLDKRQIDWVALIEKTYDFCMHAAERYEKGDIETKKHIMRTFGSHLFVNNRILEVDPRGPFKVIANGLKAEIKTFAPARNTDTVTYPEHLYLQNTVWGGVRESNPL